MNKFNLVYNLTKMTTKIDIPEGLKSSRKEAEKLLTKIEDEIKNIKLLTTDIDNNQKTKIERLFTDAESAVILIKSYIHKIRTT